jgi:hypothetical protein
MKRKNPIVDDQLKLFTKHLLMLVNEINKNGLEPEIVSELIYTARQYVNRKNKARKQ